MYHFGKLNIALSTRALFSREDHELYVTKGPAAYDRYQLENQSLVFSPGIAMPLVQAMLRWNEVLPHDACLSVTIVSRNRPGVALRTMNSLEHYGIPVHQASFLSGASPVGALLALNTHFFLSANEEDVREALRNGVPAAIVYSSPHGVGDTTPVRQVRIAFDGDSCLFDDEADRVYSEQGFEAFIKHEQMNAERPLGAGPLAKFAQALTSLRQTFPEGYDGLRMALVTARNLVAGTRVLNTINALGIHLDEAHFCGDHGKSGILRHFAPQLFLDDSERHLISAAEVVPTAHVLPK